MFSVIICTYNPSGDIILRALNAVAEQKTNDPFELIVVDNNSSNEFLNAPEIKTVLEKENTRTVSEKQQGLVYARIAGIKASKFDVIIFVDDDNVLQENYLSRLKKLLDTYKDVAVWGPGLIEPDYAKGAPDWIKKNYGGLFQQKHKLYDQYGCVAGWPDYYPAGSGMVVKKFVLIEYLKQFEAGCITATGRKGNSLASAEDSQIVWTAVKMGLAAGTSPLLQLVHIIPSNRLTRQYLSNLNFGISSSYKKALYEMFPGLRGSFVNRTLFHKFNFMVKMIIRSKGNPVMLYRFYAIENAWFKGLES